MKATLIKEYIEPIISHISPPRCLVCQRLLFANFLCSKCTPFNVSAQNRCRICFAPTISNYELSLCPVCDNHNQLFGAIRFVWTYDEVTKHFIKVMKYQPSMNLIRFGVEQLLKSIPMDEVLCADIISPLPSSLKSYRQRGINPAYAVVGLLSKELGCRERVNFNLMSQKGTKKSQSHLPLPKRIKNIKNSIVVNEKDLSGKHILLVDDVITTGATSSEAAVRLYEKGAASVSLIALARSNAWLSFRNQVYREIVGVE